MDVVHERCCGLDRHKRTVVACLIVPGPRGKPHQEGRGFGTMTADLSRPDVGAAYPRFGSAHGYDVTVPASPTASRVCVTAQGLVEQFGSRPRNEEFAAHGRQCVPGELI